MDGVFYLSVVNNVFSVIGFAGMLHGQKELVTAFFSYNIVQVWPAISSEESAVLHGAGPPTQREKLHCRMFDPHCEVGHVCGKAACTFILMRSRRVLQMVVSFHYFVDVVADSRIRCAVLGLNVKRIKGLT